MNLPVSSYKRVVFLLLVLSIAVIGVGCGSSHGTLTPVGPGGVTGDTGGGNPPPPPPATQAPTITAFTSQPESIQPGQSATLTWTTANATSVTISGVDGAQPVNGSMKVSPTQTTSYTLTAAGPGGTATFTAFVTVVQAAAPTITSFTVQPASVTKGQQVTFTWATQNAAEVMIDGVPGELPASGSVSFTPQASGDFTLNALSADETQSAKSTVHVDVLTSAVIKSFTAAPQQITSGQQSVLNWEVVGATSVKLNGEDKPPTGSMTVTPNATTTYTLVATAADNSSVQQDVIVTVSSPTAAGLKKINHIIFMVQENRSFDQYFGKLNDYRVKQGLSPDIDGIPADASNGSYDETRSIQPFEFRTQCMENTTPSWDDAHPQRNRHSPACTIDKCSPALMDGFVRDAAAIARDPDNNYFDIEGYRAMGYFTEKHLPYYYFMATSFATSNRFFAPLMAKTEPNLLFLWAATSGGYIHKPKRGDPTLPDKTIFQLLEEAGISWKFYMPSTTEASGVFIFQPFTTQHKDKFVPMQQYFDDLTNGTLPAVAFIASKAGLDEHPGPDSLDKTQPIPGGGTKVQHGAAYVSNIINSLMQSSSWKDSVFIWSFDEWGGTYDHVPPMQAVPPDDRPPRFDLNPDGSIANTPGDFSYTGFRIPMMVISPYTKKGYVSNTPMDSTAILKLIEERFDLPALTRRDAAQKSMTEFFDFDNPSWMTPPKPPAQPGTMLCDRTQIP